MHSELQGGDRRGEHLDIRGRCRCKTRRSLGRAALECTMILLALVLFRHVVELRGSSLNVSPMGGLMERLGVVGILCLLLLSIASRFLRWREGVPLRGTRGELP
jgi:hypothetical protein